MTIHLGALDYSRELGKVKALVAALNDDLADVVSHVDDWVTPFEAYVTINRLLGPGMPR